VNQKGQVCLCLSGAPSQLDLEKVRLELDKILLKTKQKELK
jgi:hypothetical protein